MIVALLKGHVAKANKHKTTKQQNNSTHPQTFTNTGLIKDVQTQKQSRKTATTTHWSSSHKMSETKQLL